MIVVFVPSFYDEEDVNDDTVIDGAEAEAADGTKATDTHDTSTIDVSIYICSSDFFPHRTTADTDVFLVGDESRRGSANLNSGILSLGAAARPQVCVCACVLFVTYYPSGSVPFVELIWSTLCGCQ